MLGLFIVAPLLPAIIESLEITPASAGLALSLMWALNAAAQYPGGRLADQLTHKTVLFASGCCSVVGALILSAPSSYWFFVIGIAILGVGAGMYRPAAIAYADSVSTSNRGVVLGVLTSSSNAAGVTGSGLAVAAVALASWRSVYAVVVILVGLNLIFVHRWIRESYRLSFQSLAVRKTGVRLLGSSRTRRIVLTYTAFALVWQGVTSFLPLYLESSKGFSPTLASYSFALVFLVGIVMTPLAGTIGDRIGHPKVAVFSTSLATVGLLWLTIANQISVSVTGLVVFAIGASAFWPSMDALTMAHFVDSSKGGDFGAVRTIFLVIGSAAPTYVGVVAEHYSYSIAFLGLVVCLGACTVLGVTLFQSGEVIAETGIE
jgi:MFS family permease